MIVFFLYLISRSIIPSRHYVVANGKISFLFMADLYFTISFLFIKPKRFGSFCGEAVIWIISISMIMLRESTDSVGKQSREAHLQLKFVERLYYIGVEV